MTCTIHWNTLLPEDRNERFANIRRSSLLQSPAYGLAMQDYEGQVPRFGMILINDTEAGLVQVLEMKALGGWIHTVALDRGPLWFEGFGGEADWSAFLKTLRTEYPRRFGRVMRFIPEASTLPPTRDFKRRGSAGYQTIWLDLRIGAESLRAELEKKWRNALAKAERSEAVTEWDDTGRDVPWLLKCYQLDKAHKNYDGASPELLRAMERQGARILTGRVGNDAGVLFILHGQSATYQIGWSGAAGRDMNAHNLLLWNALHQLKDRGIKDLDLGGINDDAQGLKGFKEGLGGETATLAGVFG